MAEIQNGDEGGNGGPGLDEPVTPVTIGKRGPGRPRKDGSTPKSAAPSRPAPKQGTDGIDAGVFADLAVSLCENGDEIAWLIICSRARAKLPEAIYPKFLAEYEAIRLRQKERESLRAAFLALAKKYDFLSKWGPEMILFVVGVQYSARMANLLRKVNALPDPEGKRVAPVAASPLAPANENRTES
jgi:hypothetical protein